MRTVLFAQRRGGGARYPLPTAQVEEYGFRLNRPGALRFSMPARPLEDVPVEWDDEWDDEWQKIIPGRPLRDLLDPDQGHEVGVWRNGVKWLGPLLTVDEQADRITFGAEGLMSYLKWMHVTETLQTTNYPNPLVPGRTVPTDQHLLIGALIDHHQVKAGGDFDLDTTQLTPSGTVRDRQYKRWEAGNIYDLVINLTEVIGGPDVHIDPATRQVRCWTPRRGMRRKTLVFNDRNVRAFSRTVDKTVQATQVLGFGAGEGEDMLRVDRTSSLDVSRVGLLQTSVTHSDVSRQDTLLSHVDAHLRDRASLPNMLSVTVATDDPELFSYEVGDECRVHYASPYQKVDDWRRIVGIDVRPHAGEETAVLHLERLGQ